MAVSEQLVELLTAQGLDGTTAVQVAYIVQQAKRITDAHGYEVSLEFAGDIQRPRSARHYHDDRLAIAVWDMGYLTRTIVQDRWLDVLVATLTETPAGCWTGSVQHFEAGDWLAHLGTVAVLRGVLR